MTKHLGLIAQRFVDEGYSVNWKPEEEYAQTKVIPSEAMILAEGVLSYVNKIGARVQKLRRDLEAITDFKKEGASLCAEMEEILYSKPICPENVFQLKDPAEEEMGIEHLFKEAYSK